MRTVITNNDFKDNSLVKNVVNYLMEHSDRLNLQGATLYYKYPKYNNDNLLLVPEIFIVSPVHGIVVINTSEKSSRECSSSYKQRFYEELDDIVGLISSQFIKIKSLRKSRRELVISINTIAFFPNCDSSDFEEDDEVFTIVSLTDLSTVFERILLDSPIDEAHLRDIFSIVDGSRSIPNDNKRNISEDDKVSKGAILSELDKQIATFDYQQQLAALTIIDGPQRIRGMAGSGKTVVLAMKAALLHINNPEQKILYTFYTKSLYDQIKRLITRFYRMTQDHDPNWDNLQIYHAWGGQNKPGVYYNTCINNNTQPLNYLEASKKSALNNMKPFEFVCYELINRMHNSITQEYDYVLIDEGQDFPNSFYWLCRRLVKKDRIIWAYDELQNILDVEPRDAKKLFQNTFGDDGIDLAELLKNHPQQSNDIILKKSYRNPKEILVSAHSLGFGIYNDRIIQMLENKDHWQDLGYDVPKGGAVGEETIIERPEENSPSMISMKYEGDEIIGLQSFEDMYAEMDYVAEQVEYDLENKLNPEDILIICLDDKLNRQYYDDLSYKLSQRNISLNNIMISSTGDQFTIKNQVTFSTVYRAKGNEAGRVYIIGADSLKNKDSVKIRNKIFTALTRSKAWVTITGYRIDEGFIDKELKQVKANDFKMIFNYPSQEEIEFTVQRELAEKNYILNDKRERLQSLLEANGFSIAEATQILRE